MTPGKRIRRRQVRIETSGQLGLLLEESAPPQLKPQGGVERALRFVEVDASRIMLGGVQLDEHLKAMSIGWPSRWRGCWASRTGRRSWPD